MPEIEFTGERVIPGLVESNLFNEHFARYRFASRLAAGLGRDAVVLDAGCGTGYGSAQFPTARVVVGIDFSLEALQYARTNFGQDHCRFIQARCEALPFADASFDLIATFEVIEHLENWPALLTEADRVMKESGLLLVSTPNKAYYAETRATAGPNPFHAHEFECTEFKKALSDIFPHVEVWRQNHTEAILLAHDAMEAGELGIGKRQTAEADEAHFFLAVCSRSPLPQITAFAWIPEAANVLRERERHIALLKQEVERRENDLGEARRVIADRDAHLQQRDRWVENLRAEVDDRNASLAAWKDAVRRLELELTATHGGYQSKIREMESTMAVLHQDYEARIASLEEQIADHEAEVANIREGYGSELQRVTADLAQTHSAYQSVIRRMEEELAAVHSGYQQVIHGNETRIEELALESTHYRELLDHHLSVLHASRWVQLGNRLGVGPGAKPPKDSTHSVKSE